MSAAASHADLLPWAGRRRFNGLGLVFTVLVHVLVLTAALIWHKRVPPPDKPSRVQISVIDAKEQPKPPEPPPLAPKPEFQPPNLPVIPEPPPVMVAEMPLPAPVVQAAPAPPAPAPAAAPAVAAPAAAAPPAPAGSAVGSTRLAEACADAPDRMMVAEVYKLSSRATSVKEMDRRRNPAGTVCLAQLDIAPRNMGLGLPGLDVSEWYGLDIRFTLNMPQDAERDFVLVCDDGCVLYIDGKEVANADGLHQVSAVMGTVQLSQGMHHVRVRYFQGPGDGALMLGWKKAGAPNSETRPIPRRLLGRPPATTE